MYLPKCTYWNVITSQIGFTKKCLLICHNPSYWILRVSNQTKYPTNPANPAQKQANPMSMSVGSGSPPLKPDTNGSVDWFEHRKLISINPTRYTLETCCSPPIGVVGLSILSNLLRFGLISSRFTKISLRSSQIPKKSTNFGINSSIFAKFRDVSHSPKPTETQLETKGIWPPEPSPFISQRRV